MQNNQKGISLIMVFFIMLIMIAMVLGVSTILYKEILAISDIGNSAYAVPVAEGGREKAMYYDIKKVPLGGTGSGLCNTCNTCPISGSDPNTYCNNCTLTELVLDGCNPLTCSNCTISFDSSDGVSSNSVSATIGKSCQDPSVQLFNLYSTGVYRGVTRQETEFRTSASNAPPSNLIAYWKFNEDQINDAFRTVEDSGSSCTGHGGSYNGTANGQGGSNPLPQPSTDVPSALTLSSRSLSFDGTDDYVDMGNQSGLFISGSFSISVWVKVTGGQGTTRSIFGDYNTAGCLSSYALRVNSSNKFAFFWENPCGTFPTVTSTTTVSLNTWYHVVLVWDSPSHTRKLYVNAGTPNTNATSEARADNGGNTTIGASGSYLNGQRFYGKIDDLRIFDKALSTQEVTDLYNGVNLGASDSCDCLPAPGD